MEIKRPLGPRILIKQDRADTVTASGIIIPDSVQETPIVWGTVVSVGTPTHSTCCHCSEALTLDVKAGDRILFPPSQGNYLFIAGSDHVLINADLCLAVDPQGE